MRQFFVAAAIVLALSAFKLDQLTQQWNMTIHARSVSINSSTLVMSDVNDLVMLMSSGGEREMKMVNLSKVIQNWNTTFNSSEPNAVVSTIIDGQVYEVVVLLGQPKLVNQKLTFPIKQLGVEKSFQGKEAVLYIDGAHLAPSKQ